MKYLTLILIIWSSNLVAQDFGRIIEQKKYSFYSIEYHDDYDGEKEDADVYEEIDGEKQYMGAKYNTLIVTIYENKVKIERKGKYANSKGVYGKGKRIKGPNWYGYELANNMQLVISEVNSRIYSEPEEIDGEEVFMVEEVFMNPIKKQ